jgi:hypothetical protein
MATPNRNYELIKGENYLLIFLLFGSIILLSAENQYFKLNHYFAMP